LLTGREAHDFVVRAMHRWRQAVKDAGAKAN
jgi:hypothetical protein